MTPQLTNGQGTQIDDSVWTTSLTRIGGFFTSLVNEFMQCIQAVANPTNSQSSYEKCGQIIQAIQKDSSDYGKGITRDLVAQSRVGKIEGGTQTGRVWGGYDEAGCDSGSDGFVLARETGGNNNSLEQPGLNTPTSKVLESYVAGEYDGNNKMTAITHSVAGTSQFFHGHVVERDAIQNDADAFAVRDNDGSLYGLMADGTIGLRFINQSTPPQLQPGKCAIWGDTSTGLTYFVFNNGATILKAQLS